MKLANKKTNLDRCGCDKKNKNKNPPTVCGKNKFYVETRFLFPRFTLFYRNQRLV